VLFPSLLLEGQTNTPQPAVYPVNRYLLIVETSHSMAHRSEAMVRTVQNLMSSALASQARRGDSLGLWTFNEDPYTGVFPLQQWSPENQSSIVERFTGFLRAQKFEKKARLEKVIPLLNRVVKNSSFLSVVLICTGDDEVHGTPFDQRINQFFQNWRQQQLDARTPFVIALRAQDGAFVDCIMNPSPWPPELPPLPKQLFVAIPPARPPAAEPRKHAASNVPPLIISGHKHPSPPPATNSQTSPPAVAVTGQSAGNLTAQTPLASSATTSPALPRDAVVATAGQSALVAVPAQALPGPGTVPSPKPESSPSAQVQLSGPDANPVPPTDKVSRSPSNISSMLAANAGSTAIVAQTAPPSIPAQAPLKPSVSEPAQATPSGVAPPAVDVANINTTSSHLRPIILWLTASISTAAILAAIWYWRRRSHSPGGEVSLITESIDRRKR
jgi:hypothetical protein